MSAEDYVKEIRDRHKEDIEEIEKLLELLRELREEDRAIYSFYVTSNL
jgi:hypothetical protein